MTEPEWIPETPWVKLDGTNAEDIQQTMDDRVFSETQDRLEGPSHIVLNDEYTGESLSLNQVYGDGQIGRDRWRVPQGYWFNPVTGEVRNKAGIPQDWDLLVAMG